MSETIRFWLGFGLGLSISVAGIIVGIRAEALHVKSRLATGLVVLGGVVMIAVARFWYVPELPWWQWVLGITVVFIAALAVLGIVLKATPFDQTKGR